MTDAASPTAQDWERLHAYWFDTITPDDAYMPGRLPIWFFAAPEHDAHIRAHFAPWLATLTDAVEAAWRATPRGALALLVLLDQIPRNAFRGTPESFAYDARGLALAEAMLASGAHATLTPIERFFVALPLQHQEDLALQQRQRAMIRALAQEAPAGHAKFFGIAVDMAERHHDAIARFGRFPHRNVILGRATTPEEAEFLEDPKNHF